VAGADAAQRRALVERDVAAADRQAAGPDPAGEVLAERRREPPGDPRVDAGVGLDLEEPTFSRTCPRSSRLPSPRDTSSSREISSGDR